MHRSQPGQSKLLWNPPPPAWTCRNLSNWDVPTGPVCATISLRFRDAWQPRNRANDHAIIPVRGSGNLPHTQQCTLHIDLTATGCFLQAASLGCFVHRCYCMPKYRSAACNQVTLFQNVRIAKAKSGLSQALLGQACWLRQADRILRVASSLLIPLVFVRRLSTVSSPLSEPVIVGLP